MTIKNQTQTSAVGKYRWTICALLFLATTINYIDRQILSLIKPILDEELHWSNEEFGMVNSAFQGAYAVGLLFFGWFVDRFGAKVGYAVSIVAWSFAAMGHRRLHRVVYHLCVCLHRCLLHQSFTRTQV